LIPKGVYNTWIDKSLQKLAEFVPAKYDKPEESSGIVVSLDTYTFEIERPAPEPPESRADEVEENQAAETAPVGEPDSAAVDMVVGGSGDEGVLIDAEVQ
jgi:cellulose synthase operon protein C